MNGTQITSLPLNGRSYTDLLAIQPGVTPATTLLPSSVIMAGVTGAISPSGDQNPGNVSINGQRESSNGFFVDGIDVQEHMNGGTSVLPNIDSLSEFRVLTNNFDPEYGNYNGGMITVITRSGSDTFHGRAFDFFRNTVLDSRGYFDPTKSAFRQHQFGGAIGGPLAHTGIYFFGDYQGTRTTQGIPTGRITVFSSAERRGDFSSASSALSGCVSGPYLASLLSQRTGRTVNAGDPYSERSTSCNPGSSPVFPGGLIPQSAWSAPAQHLIQYIPSPNVDVNQFSSSSFNQTVRDDKGSWRLDRSTPVGQLSAYYFLDDYRLNNPYPGRQGGASIPGFDALSIGRAQLFAFGLTSPMDAQTVNELHIGYLRNANVIGEPNGGRGVSLASQGFTTGPGTAGIVVQAPEFEGIENIAFPTFTMGVPITNVDQVNNTLFLSESVAHAIGRNTLKAGVQFHTDQVNEHPNATFNGTFNINGTETGSAFADFLIGTPSNFTQSSGQPFYLRNSYTGLFIQDSWRLRDDLTINAGLRWDFIAPWSEKYNQIQTVVPGQQSVVFPGAPTGFVFPGDPGIPSSLAPRRAANLAPRLGIAYVPNPKSEVLRNLLGNDGKTSFRASFGMFYTAFPGLATGIMYAVPPFGYNYLSPSPPIFETPFINAKDGINNGQRFPFPFPAHGASASRPDNSIDWSNFVPISADPYFDHRNTVAYTENYMLSLQRQIGLSTLATVSYVGNQGHHILMLLPTNPGDPALCLSLPGCGPFGEDAAYISTSGDQVQGTRRGLGPDYGAMTAQRSIGNSNYNALEANVRYTSGEQQVSVGYTFSKSIDQGSNLGEQLNPIDQKRTRAISAFDLRQNLIVSYTADLPFRRLFSKPHAWAVGWSLAGTMRASSGFPVTLYDNSDNSLLGTLGNGVNNYLLDTPNFAGGPLNINTNGRNGRAAFNTSQFTTEQLGQLGNTHRRFFYGPGQINFDTAISKSTALRDGVSLDLRLETFNTFNHAQFFGPAAVAGQIQDSNFGRIVSASPPRLVQIAAKMSF
ncbi:MAG: TonB-dependent receptor [Edaphobacter sp.]|uniref:TonB-dependent receptor n=1 Tax=Edaphobacter sp. TaxID=1934404 RepID=UPI00238884C8|nr:TonB-dependent receptor [Edaphobacter sp.]MDE1178268.1 TonB-dependent receptor [Edaphobacter sp.]